MSGIYIPGISMPTSCEACPMAFAVNFGILCTPTKRIVGDGEISKKQGFCPLVPVPEHGRLIEADALDDILADQSEDAYNRTHAPRSWERALSAMRDYLEDAPTIIPADPVKEET